MSPEQTHLLSVIVPSYNRRELLRRCLDSLALQTQDAGDFEVVVIDDGSSDGTAEMVDGLHTPYRLQLLRGKQQRWAAARNAGVAAAAGRVCLHVDDDIVCSPKLVAEHIAVHAASDREVGIGKLIQAPPDADDWYARAFAQGLNEHYTDLLGRPPTWTDCYGANLSSTAAVFIEVGGFATDLPSAVDLEFGFRLCEAGCKLHYLAEAEGTHDDQKLSGRMLEDARVSGRAHVLVVERHPSTEPNLLDWVGPAGPRELALRRALIGLRVPPSLLASLGRFLPARGRKMIWLHFVRRLTFWRSVRHQVSARRWRELTVERPRRGREPGLAPSVP
ncbi:MAG: glycosyltransferase family A protein [Solirubrobacterales bacterium]